MMQFSSNVVDAIKTQWLQSTYTFGGVIILNHNIRIIEYVVMLRRWLDVPFGLMDKKCKPAGERHRMQPDAKDLDFVQSARPGVVTGNFRIGPEQPVKVSIEVEADEQRPDEQDEED